jgi:hypothetical protein
VKYPFKKGDIIRATETSAGNCFIKGQTYKVIKYDEHYVYVELDSRGYTTNGWGFDRFELVEKKINKSCECGSCAI